MTWRHSIWLLACAALVGCAASEGGVTGTGITAISGNVTAVQESLASETLPFTIRVTVAGLPGVESTTDADGVFQLAGEFSGAVELVFSNANDGDEIGPLTLEVPAGSQTVLENIEIRTAAPPADRVQPRAVRQFDVFGRADLVECREDGTGTALLTDEGRPPRQFMLSLTAETEIATRAGAPLTCADIAVGASLRAEGLLRRRDQTLIAMQVIVLAPRPPRPNPSPRPERLRGVVTAVDCGRSTIELEQNTDEAVRRLVRLNERTEFQCAPDIPGPCDCSAIALGAPIGVEGTILPQRPGQVRADVVYVQITSVAVDVLGTITRLACNAGGFAMEEDGTHRTVRVALTAATRIRCAPDSLCGCADLRPQQRVRVEGHRPPEGGTVTADRVTVRQRQ